MSAKDCVQSQLFYLLWVYSHLAEEDTKYNVILNPEECSHRDGNIIT